MEYKSPESVPPEWQVGDVILNRYEVRQKFEGGGMGMVYRVYHREWDMELVVKAPRADFFQTTEQKENFEREAETWVNLGMHPHIVSCYYVRRLGGIPRLFAEFVVGGTLDDWIRDGRLYAGEPNARTLRVLDIAIQIAWALSYAHEKGLVHQDVKPANILLMPDGTAKLTDFGLARARSKLESLESSPSASMGRTIWVKGAGLLTPEYASPEQFRGEKVSSRSDGWSWALTVLEMMQGERGWIDGRFGPDALSAHYQERIGTDPIASVLGGHLNSDRSQRSASLESDAGALISVYETLSKTPYHRSRHKDGKASLTSDDLNNRGVALLELGQVKEAENFLWEAHALDDRNPHVVFNLEVSNWRGLFCPASTDLEVIDHLLKIRDENTSSTIAYLLRQLVKERGFPQGQFDADVLPRDQMVAGLREMVKIPTHEEADAPSLLALTTTHRAKTAVQQEVPHILGLDCNGTLHKWSLAGELQHSVPLSPVNCPLGSTSVFRGGIFTEDSQWLITTEKVTEGMERDAPSAIHVSVHDTIDGKRMSSQLAHQARNGPYHSFWDKLGLNCLQLLSNELLVTVGHNDWLLRVWSLPELAMIAEITLPKEDANNKHRTATELLEDKTSILGQIKSKVGINYTVELTGQLLEGRKVVIYCWSDSSVAPRPDSAAAVENNDLQTKKVVLAMNIGGHPYWMAPDRKSLWKNVRDIATDTIWGRSSLDKKFYLSHYAQDWHKTYSFVTHCSLFASAAFTQNSDYLILAGGGYSHVNGELDKGHLHLVDTVARRCLCTLVDSAFDRSVFCAYTTDNEIVVLVCHGSSLSECRIRRPARREFFSLARPSAIESLRNAEEEQKAMLILIRSALCENRYLQAISLFQAKFDSRHFFRGPEISLMERRIVQHIKPAALKTIIWERDFDFKPDEVHPGEGKKYFEAFTCVTGMHVLVSEEGWDKINHRITEVASGNSYLSAVKDAFPQRIRGQSVFISRHNGRFIRVNPATEQRDTESWDDSIPNTVSVSNNYALGSDSDFHLAVWRLVPFEQILITDVDWEANYVEGLLSLERNPGAHVRLSIAFHKYAAVVACHVVRTFRSFLRDIKTDDTDSIFARVPQKLRHCYNMAAAVANVSRVSRRDADATIKSIDQDFVGDEISAVEGGGVISKDGKWIVVIINIDSPIDRTLLVQFSSRSLQAGFLFEVPDKAECLSQLRLINDDQTVVGLADKELLIWCVETGKITERVLLPENGLSIDAKCYPFIFVGFVSGSIAVVDATRGVLVNQSSVHSQPVHTLVLSDDHLRLVINSRRVYHIVWVYAEKQPAILENKTFTLGLRHLEQQIAIDELRDKYIAILYASPPDIECDDEDDRNKHSEQFHAQQKIAADRFIDEHFASTLEQWRKNPSDPSPLRKIAQAGFVLHQERKSVALLHSVVTENEKNDVPLADFTGVYLDLGRLGQQLKIPIREEHSFYRRAIYAKTPPNGIYKASGELKAAACKYASTCEQRTIPTFDATELNSKYKNLVAYFCPHADWNDSDIFDAYALYD